MEEQITKTQTMAGKQASGQSLSTGWSPSGLRKATGSCPAGSRDRAVSSSPGGGAGAVDGEPEAGRRAVVGRLRAALVLPCRELDVLRVVVGAQVQDGIDRSAPSPGCATFHWAAGPLHAPRPLLADPSLSAAQFIPVSLRVSVLTCPVQGRHLRPSAPRQGSPFYHRVALGPPTVLHLCVCVSVRVRLRNRLQQPKPAHIRFSHSHRPAQLFPVSGGLLPDPAVSQLLPLWPQHLVGPLHPASRPGKMQSLEGHTSPPSARTQSRGPT